MMADFYARRFADQLGIDKVILEKGTRYEEHYAEAGGDDFHTIEVHEGGRTQIRLIEQILANQGLEVDNGRLVAASDSVLGNSLVSHLTISEIVAVILNRYKQGSATGLMDEAASRRDQKENEQLYKMFGGSGMDWDHVEALDPNKAPDESEWRQPLLTENRYTEFARAHPVLTHFITQRLGMRAAPRRARTFHRVFGGRRPSWDEVSPVGLDGQIGKQEREYRYLISPRTMGLTAEQGRQLWIQEFYAPRFEAFAFYLGWVGQLFAVLHLVSSPWEALPTLWRGASGITLAAKKAKDQALAAGRSQNSAERRATQANVQAHREIQCQPPFRSKGLGFRMRCAFVIP